MKFTFGSIVTLLLWSGEVVAVPAVTSTFVSSTPTPSVDACATLASQAKRQNPPVLSFKPSDAYACLQAIPFSPFAATNLTTYLMNLAQFQTTLSYLKNPPQGYQWPAFDMMGQFQNILNKIKAGSYKNQYAFELDLYGIAQNTHDGHFHVNPVLPQFFQIRREPLVSISSDGSNLPQIFIRRDINSTGFNPSPVTKINGQDVDSLMLQQNYLFQDKDATYNSAFYNPIEINSGNSWFGSWGLGYLDFNDTTIYSFANGSTATLSNVAITSKQFGDFPSGPLMYIAWVMVTDIYKSCLNNINQCSQLYGFTIPVVPGNTKRLVNPANKNEKRQVSTPSASVPASASASVDPIAATASALLAQVGLPSPVAHSQKYELAGYYLNDKPDTAVLTIRTFTTEAGVDFQKALSTFLADCKAKGKTKLLIDVRGNDGGTTALAYDAFKQLFPQIDLFMRIRARASSGANSLGAVISQSGSFDDFWASTPNQNNLMPIQVQLYQALLSIYDVKNVVQYDTRQAFASWNSFFGPKTINGDSFTNYFAWNFTDLAYSQQSGGGINVTGYGNLINPPPAVFASSNITYITDGECGSSCGIFSNLVLRFGNVSSIAFGGQPNKNPMAVIGGTQGAQVRSQSSFKTWALAAYTVISGLKLTVDSSIGNDLLAFSTSPVLQLNSDFEVNFLDNMAPGTSDVPLQFTSDKANCRLFYTANDINNVMSTWSKVSSGNYTCVDGGTKPGDSKKSNGIMSFTSSSSFMIVLMATSIFLLF